MYRFRTTRQTYLIYGAIFLLIIVLPTLSYFQCSIPFSFPFFNANASVCDVIAKRNELRERPGFSETEASSRVCDGTEYVDYSDVEKYLEMKDSEIALLDSAINGNPDEYAENYQAAFDLWKLSNSFYKEKILKCFGGENGTELAADVSRLNNFTSEKFDVLYNLAYNQ